MDAAPGLDLSRRTARFKVSNQGSRLFVFVDECHRTQSGKLHRTVKALMPNAVFIGFTGTPLLKQDKATSLEVFGGCTRYLEYRFTPNWFRTNWFKLTTFETTLYF